MTYDEDLPPKVPAISPAMNRKITIGIGVLLGLVILLAAAGQSITFLLNFSEFGDLYLRPIYFIMMAGAVLSPIALFRVDFKNRRSLSLWAIKLAGKSFQRRLPEEGIPLEDLDFSSVKLKPMQFAIWQITKVVIGAALFGNVIFGFAISGVLGGWATGIGSLGAIFSFPFIAPPADYAFAQANVVPMIPSLTLIITPLLGAIGIRLVVLLGLTQLLRIGTSVYIEQAQKGQMRFPTVAVQSLLAIAAFWTAFNLFFSSFIDFNTKFLIGGVLAFGGVMVVFALYDKLRRGPFLQPPKKSLILRGAAIALVILLAGSMMGVQTGIADARKVEWRGPYTAQQIGVNRYLAQLDEVNVQQYDFGANPVPPSQIAAYVDEHEDVLGKVRVWDREAAFAKMKPEIGLIPYVDFQDSDILRFNDTLYWSASMKPILPSTVQAEDAWFNTHFVYTHVPNGFLLLDGHEGVKTETDQFFPQRQIYYGEGGLLEEAWAAFPSDRSTSDEVGGSMYTGLGGVDMPPPISWIFEGNFVLSYPTSEIHSLRYQDVYERMELLFPYFLYELEGKRVDMFPVSDGEDTYWLMPLLVGLPGNNIPWSTGNPLIRLLGYAIIDTYDGSIQILVLGDDFFSNLFEQVYSDYVTTETPVWLETQMRYPEELFRWRINMFNFYHVTDPATYIVAKEFFEVPATLVPYYIMAKPPGLDEPEFIGLLSLELRGSAGRNLAGYMIVRNDHPRLGEMDFYSVPLDSETKLLGPSAIVEALERNPDFATLRTLLRDPRLGDNILYRVGDHDVYFIPVYTAGAGGVVAELGGVAAVGAAFTGEYHVGFGSSGSPQVAFASYLDKLGGIDPELDEPEMELGDRIMRVEGLFTNEGLAVVKPTTMSPPLTFKEGESTYINEDQWEETEKVVQEFLNEWVDPEETRRVISWTEGNRLNFGIFEEFDVVLEVHYVSIEVD